MQWSLENFELEREDLHQDLMGIDLNLTKCRVGDFACGWGNTSLSLMLELQCRECIGVDQFEKNINLDVPSIQDVEEQFEKIKNIAIKNTNSFENSRGINDIHYLLESERFPTFQIGNIVTGNNLPSELDFIYCKKLLQNILEGGYSNPKQGDEGVKLAIKNIANAVKQQGHICLVEPAGTNFMAYLEQAGLELIRCCRIQRSEIIGTKRNLLYKAQYLIYHYLKA